MLSSGSVSMARRTTPSGEICTRRSDTSGWCPYFLLLPGPRATAPMAGATVSHRAMVTTMEVT